MAVEAVVVMLSSKPILLEDNFVLFPKYCRSPSFAESCLFIFYLVLYIISSSVMSSENVLIRCVCCLLQWSSGLQILRIY
jgi:hypothetical protein